jgi:CheY-like chemotaxis protein
MSTRPVVIVRTRDEREKASARVPARPEPAPESGPAKPVERRPHTFLVVDDSAVHLNLLARQLQAGLGCHVVQADGVESAITYLLTTRPDVMMVDLMMPELDGIDLITILETREEWRSIPIVINSAVSDHDRVRSLKGARVREYLLKPFNPQIALPRLDRILRAITVQTSPPRPLRAVSDDIPVLLAGTAAAEELRAAMPPSYELVAVPSGPAALVAAVELGPWIAFVGADVTGWPLTKTTRALTALKAAGRLRTIPLPKTQEREATLEIVKRELGQGPFELEVAQGEMRVRVSETFTPSCIRALRRDIDGAMARGVGRIVVDIPYHSIQRSALLVLRELITGLRGDADPGGRP